MGYQTKITQCANNTAKKLSPDIKKAAKAALNNLAKNPFTGKEFQAELSGFWSYRFKRYRIVYRIDTQGKYIIVWGLGHRRDIYEAFSDYLLNSSKK